MGEREPCEGGASVINADDANIGKRLGTSDGTINDQQFRAGLGSSAEIVVTVMLLALDGEVRLAGEVFTRVDPHAGNAGRCLFPGVKHPVPGNRAPQGIKLKDAHRLLLPVGDACIAALWTDSSAS